jgi:predicted DsbA family dithiol-disulfide isomerase
MTSADPANPPVAPVIVEVFAEIGCPFTHVGLRRFVAARHAGGHEHAIRLRVRSWPLEVINGDPMDPEFVAEEIAELRAQATPELFTGFDPDAFPATSLPAMALAATANQQGPAVGEAVSLELRDRLFERGEDVSDAAVLAAMAAAHGVTGPDGGPPDLSDHAAVLADHAEGERRGVIGSPHFFTPAGDFFCPSMDIERVDGHLEITADPEGFDRFIQSCLAAVP